ncbi:hypothetical protein P9305_22760 [Lysinibacillus capsici]|uniref:hypothetical protein n=1 Tax=Lysinibacillus capsici TaxID=2115968 RepID=UPI002E1E6A21|nr:hypothetical protein [Lysinibacillus capsici]
MYHQTTIIKNCPYHPTEVLTNQCPNCCNPFRNFNLGFQEDAFCCQNCNQTLLKEVQFNKITSSWKTKSFICDPFINRLNTKISINRELYFIFPGEYSTENIKKSSNILVPNIIDSITLKNSVPTSYNKKSCFQLQYPIRGQKNISYYLRMLIEKDINPQSPRYLLNRFIKMQLDLELFKQSKAIMKSVERYILKQLNKKNRIVIKRAYNKYGYDASLNLKDPFIEWKNECYGDWLLNTKLGRNYPTFKFKSFDFHTQIFPYFHSEDRFQFDFNLFLKRVDSYSLLTNIFNKLLFSYLYANFLRIYNDYTGHEILIKPCAFIIKEKDETVKSIKFICDYPKII